MFWGYSPAIDVLREYFAAKSPNLSARAHRDKNDAVRCSKGSRERSVVVTEIVEVTECSNTAAEDGAPTADSVAGAEEDDVELGGVKHELEGGANHAEEDNAADDAGRRVQDGGGGVSTTADQDEAGPDGGSATTQLQRDRLPGSSRPVQVADAPHSGRYVHLNGAVDLQPSSHSDHPVRPDYENRLPTSAAAHHLRNADCGQEVVKVSRGSTEDLTADHDKCQPSSSARAVLEQEGDEGDRDGPRASQVPCESTVTPGPDTQSIPWSPPGLFDVAPSSNQNAASEDCLRVLVLGGLDARHVLKTLSCLHRHRLPQAARVRVYVAEPVMEVVARQLVLLLAALEPPDKMGMTEKVRLIMELMGNALVRPSTARWLRHAARLLVDLVTNPSALARRLPVVNLSQLRHQDRDRLEDIFAFYQERPQGFRIGFHWDQRVRKHLKTRYDSRAGAFDWDYHMVLRDLPGGDKVCVHEYRHWRETGVAFTWLEGEQAEPNLTFGAGIFREGSQLLHGGYLGDILSSPYIAYAIQLEDEDAAEMFRKANDRYVARSTDVTERHLSRIVFELQHREDFTPPKQVDSTRTGVLLTQMTDQSRLNPAIPPADEDTSLRQVCQAADMMSYSALPIDGAEVMFLSPKFLRPEGRHAHVGQFHAAFLGRGLAEKHLDSDLVRVLAPGALLIVEGTRFLLEKQEGRDKYAANLKERATAAGLRPLGEFDPTIDDFAKFVLSSA